MKLQVGELQGLIQAIERIIEKDFDDEKVGYWLARFYSKAVSAYRSAERERVKIMEAYCVKDEKGKPVFENGNYKLPEDSEAFVKAREIMEREIDIPITFFPVPLGRFIGMGWSVKNCLGLDKLIEEEKPKKGPRGA